MAKQNWKGTGPGTKQRSARWESAVSETETKRGFRISRGAIFSLLFLLMLFASLAWLIRMLDPVAPTGLLTLSGGDSSLDLPVNSTAEFDALLLAKQSVLDTTLASVSNTTQEGVLAGIHEIEVHRPRILTMLPWYPSTSMVYVNMTGVALPQSGGSTEGTDSESPSLEAYLIPSDFSHGRSPGEQLIPFDEVLKAVIASQADRKILVLDCQKAEPNFVFSATADQFNAAVQARLKRLRPEETEGLFVLLSCQSSELAWPWPSRTQSVFGTLLAEGISGAADTDGDQNERVTLHELVKFLSRRVPETALQLCHADQNPVLLDFGKSAESVTLVALSRNSRFVVPDSTSSRSSRSTLMTSLQKNWSQYHELRQQEPPPAELTPVRWRVIESSLLLAEAQVRGHKFDQADATLRQIDAGFASILESHETFHQVTNGFSSTVGRFLAPCSTKPRSPTADPLASEDPVETQISEFLSGRIGLEATAAELSKLSVAQAVPLNPDAQLIRLMAAGRPDLRPSMSTDSMEKLVVCRRLAETAGAPAYPLVSPWTRTRLHAADQQRREYEDLFLSGNSVGISVGPNDPSVVPGDPEKLYEEIIDSERGLTEAFRLRDQLLAELPFWIRFLQAISREKHVELTSRTESPGEPSEPGEASPVKQQEEFESLAEEIVPLLIRDVAILTRRLAEDPSEMEEGPLAEAIKQIQSDANAIGRTHLRLRKSLADYVVDLLDDRLSPPNAETWRKVDSVLTLPFACAAYAGSSNEAAGDLARRRIQLMEKSLLPPQTDSQGVVGTTPKPVQALDASKESSTESTRATNHSALLGALFAIPLPLDQQEAMPAPDSDPAIWSQWLDQQENRLRQLADNHDVSKWENLLIADLAFRILPAVTSPGDRVWTPTIALRGREVAGMLLSQGLRSANDFYAGSEEEQDDYFSVMAEQFQGAALNVHNAVRFLEFAADGKSSGSGEEKDSIIAAAGTVDSAFSRDAQILQSTLEHNRNLLKNARLESQPADLLYRATSAASVQLTVSQRTDFPKGIAAIEINPRDRLRRFQPSEDHGEAKFEINQPSASAEGSDRLEATVSFRGHVFRRQLGSMVVNELDGTSLVYRQQNSGNGRLFLRAKRISERPLQLLFVLDCSRSMSFEDEDGDVRIHSLSRILRRFADVANATSIEAGIRLFGHRIADIEDPAARTDTERILQIGPFNRSQLEKLLPLVPTGHSPVFTALLQSKSDFPAATEGVRREIVLISDGADNWAQAGEQPGIKELREQFADSGIRINTLGYNVERFADTDQLKAIASETGGRYASVSGADSLFRELLGLAGLPGYRVMQNGNAVAEGRQLDLTDQPLELSPGDYEVEIVGPADDVISGKRVRVLPGEEHHLVYDSGKLAYASDPSKRAIAFVEGSEQEPDLVVVAARRVDKGLDLEFGLLPKDTLRDFILPVTAEITATENGVAKRWRIQDLHPNVGKQHFPVWNLRLEGWPEKSQEAQLKVRWNQPRQKSFPVVLDWSQEMEELVVAPGVRLVRRTRRQDASAGEGPEVTLTFAFDQFGPEVFQWSVVPASTVRSIRHVYRSDVGVYTAQFTLVSGEIPESVELIQSSSDPVGPSIEALVPLADERINP